MMEGQPEQETNLSTAQQSESSVSTSSGRATSGEGHAHGKPEDAQQGKLRELLEQCSHSELEELEQGLLLKDQLSEEPELLREQLEQLEMRQLEQLERVLLLSQKITQEEGLIPLSALRAIPLRRLQEMLDRIEAALPA